MKISILVLLVSFQSLASTITSTDAITLGERMQTFVIEEELGTLKTASCERDDSVLSCEFIYDLPQDYCWYGEFKVEAIFNYSIENGARLDSYQVNWQY